ncbi:MAG TPA: YceI family protein [Pirellulales bacterium]|nr:YceI family protein [Pirellulales bacterium]
MTIVADYKLLRRGARISTLALLAGLLVAASRPVRAEEGQVRGEKEVNVEASRVYIFVGKVGLGHEHGVVGRVKSGSILLGAKSQAGEIVFDMPSFVADTAEARKYLGLEGETPASRQKEVTANMVGADVLDVRKFPTATFKIASALPLKNKSDAGNPLYRLAGEFTLHGVKRPLKLDAEVIAQSGGARIRGSFKILQTDYGIEPFSKAFGAIGVTDELAIHGEILLGRPRVAASRGRE